MIENVILDFGHGGIDSEGKYTTSPKKMHKFPDGTVAYEGVLNRKIGEHIYECLSIHEELNVVMTVSPDDPRDLSLRERVNIANAFPPESTIFVSVHCNASPNHNAGGFEVYSSMGSTNSDILAADIHKSCKHPIRYWEMNDRGVKEANFYVLRKTLCTAVLIECGFFDFREEFDKLNDSLFQGDLGSFIYSGIINYIKNVNTKDTN